MDMDEVFICYHRSNGTNKLVSLIAEKLHAQGIRCFYDVKGYLDSGFAGKIQRAIENCKVFLFIWDNWDGGANEAQWCKQEVRAAFDADKTIIPFRWGLEQEKENLELQFYCNTSTHIEGGFAPNPKAVNLEELIKHIVAGVRKHDGQVNEEPEDNLHNGENTRGNGNFRPGKFAVALVAVAAAIALLINLLLIYSQRLAPVIRPRNDTSNTVPEVEPIVIGTGPELKGDNFKLDRAGYLTLFGDMDKGENDAELLRDYKTAAKILMVAPGVSRLCDGLFQNFSNLKIAYISSSVHYVGLYTFRDCGSLEEVVFYGRDVTLKAYAFLDCKSLSSIQIPEGVTEIPLGCFWGCMNLETVILPESLISIEESAFYQCGNLKEVSFPAGLKKLGDYAFGSSYELSSDALPDGIERGFGDFPYHII